MKFRNRVVTLLLAISIVAGSVATGAVFPTAAAATTTGSTVLSVTFPSTIDIDVGDPTKDATSTGVIQNNNTKTVAVSFLGIKATDSASPPVVAPNSNASYWSSLDASGTAANINLGFNIDGMSYWSPAQTASDPSVQTGNSIIIQSNSSKAISGIARHGNSWTQNADLNYMAYFRVKELDTYALGDTYHNFGGHDWTVVNIDPATGYLILLCQDSLGQYYFNVNNPYNSTYYSSWTNSYIRHYLNNTSTTPVDTSYSNYINQPGFLSGFTDSEKSQIIPVSNRGEWGATATLPDSTDSVWLPSTTQIYGTDSTRGAIPWTALGIPNSTSYYYSRGNSNTYYYWDPTGGAQFQYFANQAQSAATLTTAIKTLYQGQSSWLRSPSYFAYSSYPANYPTSVAANGYANSYASYSYSSLLGTRPCILINPNTSVDKFALSQSSVIVSSGTVTLKPSTNTTGSTQVTWVSDDTRIASVDATGTITAKGNGKTKITATCNGYSASCDVYSEPSITAGKKYYFGDYVWTIVDAGFTANRSITLMCDTPITGVPWGTDSTDWSKSNLRSFLNNSSATPVDSVIKKPGFLSTFSADDKARIAPATQYWKTGSQTSDDVWLPNVYQLYYSTTVNGFSAYANSSSIPTRNYFPLFQSKGSGDSNPLRLFIASTYTQAPTWLREVNLVSNNVFCVGTDGKLTSKAGTELLSAYPCVTISYNNDPAVWSNIVLNQNSATMKVGDTLRLTGRTNTSISTPFEWSSSNAAVATVSSDGVITAKTAGTVTITAKIYSPDSGSPQYSADTCTISVTDA